MANNNQNLEDFRITLNEQLEAIHTTIDEFFPIHYTPKPKTPIDVAEDIAEGREEDLIKARNEIEVLKARLDQSYQTNAVLLTANHNYMTSNIAKEARIVVLEQKLKETTREIEKIKLTPEGDLYRLEAQNNNIVNFLVNMGFDSDTIHAIMDGAPYTVSMTATDDEVTKTSTVIGDIKISKPNKRYN